MVMSYCHIKFIILWPVVHGGVHPNVEAILKFLHKGSFIVIQWYTTLSSVGVKALYKPNICHLISR